jgi:hypothetical protein
LAGYLGEEALGVLAPEERLDGLAERVIQARALVEDHVHDARGGMLSRLARKR